MSRANLNPNAYRTNRQEKYIPMKIIKSLFTAILLLLLLTLGGCASSKSSNHAWEITRTRILIDERYDASIPQDLEQMMAPYKQRVDSLTQPVMGQLARPMDARQPESLLSNLLSDIMVWAGNMFDEHPEIGIYNIGGIRASLPAGDITFGHILEVAPFQNKLCFLSLRGDHLIELFEQIAALGGQGVSQGVALVIGKNKQLISVRINGQAIDPTKDYRIATIDYVAEGNDKMTAFKKKTNYIIPTIKKNDARDIIAAYFQEKQRQHLIVDAKIEGRITISNE